VADEQTEFCYAHAHERIARDQAAGVKVFDERGAL
jgi:hypothetical protein